MRATVSVLLFATALAGCSKPAEPVPQPPPAAPDPAASPAPPPPNTELQRAIQAPLDKARAVEQQILDEKKRKDAEIEAQGG